MAMMTAPPSVTADEPMDADGLRARYGAPDFVRREADSELWRYDSGGACAVFFFLYREGASLKLRYVETMPEGMGMMPDPACLAGLSARVRPMS